MIAQIHSKNSDNDRNTFFGTPLTCTDNYDPRNALLQTSDEKRSQRAACAEADHHVAYHVHTERTRDESLKIEVIPQSSLAEQCVRIVILFRVNNFISDCKSSDLSLLCERD